MPAQRTRADALREHLTGATADGASQSNPNLSFGNYRSATEAVSYGLTLSTPITGVAINYAGGGNPSGIGTLTAVDASHLTWRPAGALAPGVAEPFTNGETRVVEALGEPGQYLRITATLPFSSGSSGVALTTLVNNFFGMDDVSIADAVNGINEYRATMVGNESTGTIFAFKRWLATLGARQVSNTSQLGISGSGSIGTTGSLTDWPASGWCHIEDNGGTLKEVVYYISRTLAALTVPASGRALLGTTAAAGTATDRIYPVPGIAIAVDPDGVQGAGTFIQSIANANTSPAAVTWSLGITPDTGIDMGNLLPGQQVGIWIWRQVPPAAVSTPLAMNQLFDSFGAL